MLDKAKIKTIRGQTEVHAESSDTTSSRGVPLQEWFDKWLIQYNGSKLFAYPLASEQIMFVRNVVAPLVWSGVPYAFLPREEGERGDCPVSAHVIGEHSSKSIRLPVYQLTRPDLGLRLTLRGNFCDWKLAVESDRPIWSEQLPCLFQDSPPKDPNYDELAACYFEGFPADRIFGYYSQNPRRWAASIGGEHRLWTAIWICMQSAGVILPMHREEV